MKVTTEEISLLAVGASLLVPYVTEAVKKRFGRKEAADQSAHVRHAEMVAELDSCRRALGDSEAAERAARAGMAAAEAECHALRLSQIALLKDAAGKDRLLAELSENLPALVGQRQDAK